MTIEDKIKKEIERMAVDDAVLNYDGDEDVVRYNGANIEVDGHEIWITGYVNVHNEEDRHSHKEIGVAEIVEMNGVEYTDDEGVIEYCIA